MTRIGFSRIDISPGTDISLIGYEFRQQELPRGNAGILDPLHARVMVLHDGRLPAALISLDLCVLKNDVARHLRNRVAEKLKIPVERVMLACTHTHSGPFPQLSVQKPRRKTEIRTGRNQQDRRQNVEYAQFLEEKLLEASARAVGLTFPVSIGFRQTSLGIGYNRRVKSVSGVELCWNPQESPHLNPQPSPDPTCLTIQFQQINGPRKFVVWNVGAHPVVLGKTSRMISADWPGYACERLNQLIPGCESLFFNAPCGEVHPWVATQESHEQVKVVGETAATMVHLLNQALFPMESSALSISSKTWKRGDVELDLVVWKLGPLTICGLPVELFASVGAGLRAQIQGPLLISTLTNGWNGYWPSREAFEEGKYEVDAARSWGRKPGDAEELINELLTMIRGMK